MLSQLIKLANLLDELGHHELADEVDALLKNAANPYAWSPKEEQAEGNRASVLNEARREAEFALGRAVRIIDQAPYAVFTVSLKKQKFGPYEIEYLHPHARPFGSIETAMAFYRENERYGREGYIGLQRKRERLKSSGDHELLKDVVRGGRPQIVG